LPTSPLYLNIVQASRRLDIPTPESYFISEEHLDLPFAQNLGNLWSRYSADILSTVRQAQEDGLANILKAILSPHVQRELVKDLELHTAYERVKTFLKRQGSSDLPGPLSDFERRYAKEPQLKSVVSHINEVEKKIEQAMAPREKLQRLIQRMFTGNKEIYFTDRSINVETDDKTNIGLQSLSSSEKQLLRICVEALLTGESSIMIDEPEISMHIDWQR
jgi:hypothetical protein